MVDNKRTDEGLVEASRLDDSSALEVLSKRYEPPLRYFILSFSWLKDASFIDDIIQLTFVAIFEGIKKGEFDPSKGSFKNWAYGICQKICWNENKNRASQPKPISQIYPEEFPDDLVATRPEPSTTPERQEQLAAQLAEILRPLTQEERKLLWLMSEDKTYKEIQKIRPFNKYTLVNLRRKVCDLRKFLYKEAMKWQKTRKP